MIAADDSDQVVPLGLAVKESRNPENPVDAFATGIGIVSDIHSLHDGIEIGPALFIGRPAAANQPIPVIMSGRGLDHD
jgi:hypothetical protein